MSVIINGAVKLYHYLNYDIADPKTQDWFLIRTPWLGLAILAFQLLLIKRWLPAYMSTRPAFDLRGILIGFNLVQIIGCSYIVYQSLVLGWLNHYTFVCQAVGDGPEAVKFAWRVCYVYFIMKLVDLFDTIFFVLRKKHNQVTFLHVYHHLGMVAVGWGLVKWLPGGHATFLVTLNSFVHIVMYSYYLLTAWDESYKKSIWWKKHVTQVQLTQFIILFLHFLAMVLTPDCKVPKEPAYIMLPQNLFMIILFGDFYYRSYIRTPAKKN